MASWKISRRRFLRGTGATAIGLPLLDVMLPGNVRAAEANRAPVRMGCVYIPNGVPNAGWKPEAADGKLTKLNPWMSPLEPFRNDLQFLSGLQSNSNQTHQAASATWLIRPAPEGEAINETRDVGGTSMDQIVARSIRGATPFRSLELITEPVGTNVKDLLNNNISWLNGTTPVPREYDPRAVFDRLTGTGKAGQPANNAVASSRRSVLDAVLEDAKSLGRRISDADQFKVEEYLEAVRSIERRMGKVAQQQQAAAREKAASLPVPPSDLPADHGGYLRLLFDVMVLAYWTDSTRVCTFMLDHEESNRFVNFIPGVKGMWHSLSHWRSIEAGGDNFDGTSWSTKEIKYAQYLKVVEYHHQAFAYFLGRLKSIQEGDGTLLDHSMILYGSPFADGHDHQSTQLPMMIAGRAGGQIRTGHLLEYADDPAEGVYLSMMDKMGVAVREIGGCDDPVPITV